MSYSLLRSWLSLLPGVPALHPQATYPPGQREAAGPEICLNVGTLTTSVIAGANTGLAGIVQVVAAIAAAVGSGMSRSIPHPDLGESPGRRKMTTGSRVQNAPHVLADGVLARQDQAVGGRRLSVGMTRLMYRPVVVPPGGGKGILREMAKPAEHPVAYGHPGQTVEKETAAMTMHQAAAALLPLRAREDRVDTVLKMIIESAFNERKQMEEKCPQDWTGCLQVHHGINNFMSIYWEKKEAIISLFCLQGCRYIFGQVVDICTYKIRIA